MRQTFTLFLFAFLFVIFSTQGFSQEILNEDFATYEGDAPDPAGWNEFFGVTDLIDSTSSWTNSESEFVSVENSAKADFSSWNSEMIDAWLVTPSLDLTQHGGDNRLTFYYKSSTNNLGDNDSLSVMVSTDGGNSYEILKTYQKSLQTEWTKEIIDLSPYNTADVKLAFYFHDDTEENVSASLYLDNVVVEAIPDYDYAVLSADEDERTMRDTTIFSGDAIHFNAVVKNFGMISESVPFKWSVDGGAPTTNEETTSELSYKDDENYQFSSSWTAPDTEGVYPLKLFTDHANDASRVNDTTIVNLSVYEPYTSFDEDFEESAEFPLGWEAFSEDISIRSDSYYANSGDNSVYFNNTESGDAILTPAVDIVEDNSYRLTSNVSGSADATVIIGAVSEFNDTSAFVPLDTVVVEENYTYQTHELILDEPGIQQIAYKHKSGSYIYLDDISFEEIAPYDISAEMLSSEAVIPEGSTYDYKIKLRNKGYNNETFDLEVSGDWDYTIFDKTGQDEISEITIDSNENDTVVVQVEAPTAFDSVVSDEMNMSVVSQQNVEVDANETAETRSYIPYDTVEEGFEGQESLPFAWSALDEKGENVSVYNSSFNANSGTNYIQLSSADEGEVVGVSSPALEQTEMYRMNFYHKDEGVLIVGVTDDPGDLSKMDTIGEYTGGYSYEEVEVNFSAEKEHNYVVFLNDVDNSSSNVLIDDITINKIPQYQAEILSNAEGIALAADMNGSYFIEIENTGIQDETFDLSADGDWSYKVYDKNKDNEIDEIALDSEEIDTVYVAVEVPSENIEDGNTDDMEFVVTAQNDANATDTTVISTEAYNPVSSIDEGFETSSDLPGYWQGLKYHEYSSVRINAYSAYEGSNSAEINESADAEGHSYLITPVVDHNLKRYELSFYSKCYNPGDHMMIGTMTDPTDTTTFNLIDTISVEDSFTKDSLEINFEENAFIAFVTTNSGNTVNIDEVNLEILPAASIAPDDGTENTDVDTDVKITFNTAVRNMDDSEIIDDDLNAFINFKKDDESGADVIFDAAINEEKTEIIVTPEENLDSESQYYVSFADSVVEDTNDAVVPGVESQFTTKDVIAPEFADGYPDVTNVEQTEFTFNVQLNETGSVSYILVPADSEAPTVEQVLSGSDYDDVNVVSNGEILIEEQGNDYEENISGLEIFADYDLYLVAQDDAAEPNVQSNVTLVEVTTLDDQTPPEFTNDYPVIENVTDNSFELYVQLNEAGVVYYIVVDSDATSPENTEVKAGNNYEDVSIIASGSIPVSKANSAVSEKIEELDAETDYAVYNVAEDSANNPNLQEKATLVEVTTPSATGISDEFGTNIEIYPVPADNYINIESESRIEHIVIYDLLGNVEVQTNNINDSFHRLNIMNLESGYYLVKVTDETGNTITRKIKKL